MSGKIYLARSAKTFCAAALLLLGTVAMVAFSPNLIFEEPPTGSLPISGKHVLVLGGILAVCLFLLFIRVRLSDKAKRVWSYVFLFTAPFLTFTAVELINGTNFPLWFRQETLRLKKLFAHYLCYLMIFLLVYAILRSVFGTVAIAGGASLLFGIANYFVIQFRGTPILPWDLTTLGTAADVIGAYKFRLTGKMAAFILLLAAFLALIFALCGAKPIPVKRAGNIGERCSALLVSLGLMVLIIPCNLLSSLDIVVISWRQLASMKISGVATGFLANMQFLRVDKPQGYSQEAVEELTIHIQEDNRKNIPASSGENRDKPIIISVMNESLVDFTAIGNVEYTEDPLPYIHSLEESGGVIWGSAFAPVYGAGTCNSEYEYLTGNATAFLPSGCRAYQQYVTTPQPSLASALGLLGYDTVAVHPGEEKAWDRHRAYPNLGFDKYVYADTFNVERNLVRGYTDDYTNYDQVIWEYENRDTSRNLFIFNVTIQNHGGYDYTDYATTIQLKDQPGKFPQAEQYLSLARDSDNAFRELVDYFSQVDENVVVLMFGDHWPKLEDEFISLLLGGSEEELSFEQIMEMYRVPFLIWANYPLEGRQIEGTSLNYLSGILMEAAGLPLTDYQQYLAGLSGELPAIAGLGYTDGSQFYRLEDSGPYEKLLNEYQLLQYNCMFGGDQRIESFFSLE